LTRLVAPLPIALRAPFALPPLMIASGVIQI
jgi:hypothetical protein